MIKDIYLVKKYIYIYVHIYTYTHIYMHTQIHMSTHTTYIVKNNTFLQRKGDSRREGGMGKGREGGGDWVLMVQAFL